MSRERVNVLRRPVRLRVVLRYMGQLALMLAALTLLPLVASVWFGDYELTARYVIVVIVLLAVGLLARLPAPDRIQANEALVVTALAFPGSALLMSYPLTAAGLSFLDALFEAVSGVTTTGLTTLDHVETLPPTFLLARAWMQWYGGLGIVVLSVALLMGHTVAARRLAEAAYTGETLAETTRTHARRVLGVYVILTGVGLAVLVPLFDEPFAGVLHTLTAVSTGGFSPQDRSLAGVVPDWAAPVVMGLAFLGAVSLVLYHRAYQGGWRRLVSDSELRALVIAALAVSALMSGFLLWGAGLPWRQALWHGPLIGVSAQTGTGFSTLSPATLDPGSKWVAMMAMGVGGCVGSTTGGIKLLRLLILLRMGQWLVQRAGASPHAVIQPRLMGHSLDSEDVIRALLVVLFFGLVIVLSWLAFLAAGYDPLDSLFEVVSAAATVGLSTGITHSELEPWLKGVLCFDMLAGRVEIIALLLVLNPGTWFGARG